MIEQIKNWVKKWWNVIILILLWNLVVFLCVEFRYLELRVKELERKIEIDRNINFSWESLLNKKITELQWQIWVLEDPKLKFPTEKIKKEKELFE